MLVLSVFNHLWRSQSAYQNTISAMWWRSPSLPVERQFSLYAINQYSSFSASSNPFWESKLPVLSLLSARSPMAFRMPIPCNVTDQSCICFCFPALSSYFQVSYTMTEGQLMRYPHWRGLHYGTDPRLLQAHALDIGSLHITGQLPATGTQRCPQISARYENIISVGISILDMWDHTVQLCEGDFILVPGKCSAVDHSRNGKCGIIDMPKISPVSVFNTPMPWYFAA